MVKADMKVCFVLVNGMVKVSERYQMGIKYVVVLKMSLVLVNLQIKDIIMVVTDTVLRHA
jgi:hypothetical protein